jgi:hypothetical protein
MLTHYELRYPIGKADDQTFFEAAQNDPKAKASAIDAIKHLPELMEIAIQNLDADQLNTPYRPEGWTINQVVHHVADSHMNAYIRFKLGLTEVNPTIKPYDEAKWAEMQDTSNVPLYVSITLLHALHRRWVEVLQHIEDEEWSNTVYHPESKKTISLWELLGTYEWHGKHHLAHIISLKERNNW